MRAYGSRYHAVPAHLEEVIFATKKVFLSSLFLFDFFSDFQINGQPILPRVERFVNCYHPTSQQSSSINKSIHFDKSIKFLCCQA